MKKKKLELPRIGMRIIKSAFGVFLCFVIYLARGKQGAPFYSALAVLWCIQSYTKDSLQNALQRTTGTVIGAVYGLLLLLLNICFPRLQDGILHYLFLAALIIPIIYTTLLFHKKNASYFSCVVYLSIVVNHMGDDNPFLFVLDRSLDTLVGVFIGLAVNLFHIHGHIQSNVLFVADLDQALRNPQEKLTSYSRFSMNDLLQKGMNLTYMTRNTPATYLEMMSDIRPSLPIIAMDGAILYDIQENSYPKVYIMSADQADKLERYVTDRGFHLFSTVILEDVLLIYYDKLVNEAEKKIFASLHKSPYRNYLNKPRPRQHAVVYFMLIDVTVKVRRLYDEMERDGMMDRFKILTYCSDDYQGYSYLKIYNKNASAGNMIEYLLEYSGLDKAVTMSDGQSGHRAEYIHHDSNELVRHLHHLYYWGRAD